MEMSERRKSRRHPVRAAATVITPETSVSVTIVDIGAGGIRIQCPEPILPETDVALRLETPDETLLAGTILWAIFIGERKGNALYEVGISTDAFILDDREATGEADRKVLTLEILSRLTAAS